MVKPANDRIREANPDVLIFLQEVPRVYHAVVICGCILHRVEEAKEEPRKFIVLSASLFDIVQGPCMCV